VARRLPQFRRQQVGGRQARSGPQLFQRVGNPIFASYLGHLPTYLLFLVDFLRKTNLPTY
jgi:hypothetical protein